MKAPKRKSPVGTDPKLIREQLAAVTQPFQAEKDRIAARADAAAYHRHWLEDRRAIESLLSPSPDALSNQEFVLGLIRDRSIEYDPETRSLRRPSHQG
jgi:hypothetical protein